MAAPVTSRVCADGRIAVSFPRALLDSFKSTFQTREWVPHSKEWIVGPRSRKRLESWIETVAAVAAAAEEADAALLSAEAQSQELAIVAETIATISAQIAALEEQHGAAADRAAELERRQQRLADSLARRADVVRDVEVAKQRIKTSQHEIDVMLGNLCDMRAINEAVADMVRARKGGTTTANRGVFEAAQAVLDEQAETLGDAGWRWVYLDKMRNLNWNRPDRDRIQDVRGRYQVVELEAATGEAA